MSADYLMVAAVKRESHLPSTITVLILEFANWENSDRKQKWVEEFNIFSTIISETCCLSCNCNNSNISLAANRAATGGPIITDLRPETNAEINRKMSLMVWTDNHGTPMDVQIESQYISCLHPSTIWSRGFGGGGTVPSWSRAWQAKLSQMLDDNTKGVLHPFVGRLRRRRRIRSWIRLIGTATIMSYFFLTESHS